MKVILFFCLKTVEADNLSKGLKPCDQVSKIPEKSLKKLKFCLNSLLLSQMKLNANAVVERFQEH